MTYGITSAGFVLKTLDDILESLSDEQKSTFGADLNTNADSVQGMMNGIIGAELAELWQLGEAIYASQYPDSADGASLDGVAAYTGATRLPATKSSFLAENIPTNPITLNLDAGVTVSAGAIVGIPSGVRFVTLADATNGGGAPANVSVDAEAEDTGPISADAGTVTEIVTPVVGWNTVTNAADVALGRDVETDADFRVRREELLRVTGAAAAEAIRSDVLDVTDVTECYVYVNFSDVTDGDGLPPHSFEVVVSGGDADELRAAIFASGAAGIESYGTTSGTVTDSQGNTHTIKFTRPTAKPVHVIVEVTVDADSYPVDGDTQIKAAVAAFGDGLGVAEDVIDSAIIPVVFAIDGVLDVTSVLIGFSDPPTLSANLAIAAREVATIDTADVDVTST